LGDDACVTEIPDVSFKGFTDATTVYSVDTQ
jgi:hypothetical protein